MTAETAPRKAKIVAAALLSLFLPGVGVFYTGRPYLATGVVVAVLSGVMAVAAAVAYVNPSSVVALVVLTPVVIVGMVSAVVLSVRTAAEGIPPSRWHRTKTLGFALVVWVAYGVLSPRMFIAMFQQTSDSMAPTLLPGDHLFVNALRGGDVERGDVIAFIAPDAAGPNAGKVWMKRVLALSGDTVEVTAGRFIVNGDPGTRYPCDEPEVIEAALLVDTHGLPTHCVVERRDGSPDVPILDGGGVGSSIRVVRVPLDHVYVAGDNRENSSDSRQWGFLHRDDIVGRSMGVFLRGHQRD